MGIIWSRILSVVTGKGAAASKKPVQPELHPVSSSILEKTVQKLIFEAEEPSAKRQCQANGPVKLLCPGLNRIDSLHLYLFTNLLVAAHSKHSAYQSNEKSLEFRVSMVDVWISEDLAAMANPDSLDPDHVMDPSTSFVIGWPTVSFVATFDSPDERGLWFSQLEAMIHQQQAPPALQPELQSSASQIEYDNFQVCDYNIYDTRSIDSTSQMYLDEDEGTTECKLFGEDLEKVVQNGELPPVLKEMTLRLYTEGPSCPRIFRKSANMMEKLELKEAMDRGDAVNVSELPIHMVANLLMDFLRNVPGSIFGDTYPHLLASNIIDDPAKKISYISEILRSHASPAHYTMVAHVFVMFSAIAESSVTSKMGSDQLAICLAPALFWGNTDSRVAMEKIHAIDLVKFIVENANCFEV